MQLIPTSERDPKNRCWFCRTNKSVKYIATIVNTNPISPRRFMEILVCNKCALIHNGDFIDLPMNANMRRKQNETTFNNDKSRVE